MDYLEYKQLETALGYIEMSASGEKCTDEDFNSLLERFQVKDKPVGKINKYGYLYCYGNGCTEEQMNLIRGILFSTGYNYANFENKLKFGEPLYEDDKKTVKYKGNTLEDLEKLRIKAADKIIESNDFVEKLKIDKQYSIVINKGLKKLAEYKLIKEAAVKNKVFDAAMYMIEDGISITQIVSCLQADLLDIYYLAESMNCPFKLSDEEERLIEKAKKTAAEKISLQNKNVSSLSAYVSDDCSIHTNYAHV